MSKTAPYTAVGVEAKPPSPIRPAANGTSESQNSRCMLAHNTPPVTRSVTYSMW